MLTTNMIRKDLNSPNMYDAGIALSSLACFMSPDLARDLSGDIMTMLTSTKPYLRKKVSAKYERKRKRLDVLMKHDFTSRPCSYCIRCSSSTPTR